MKLSVLMTTFNHENYIAQAIESVLIQQTSFPIELLIGEDCSTDSTRSIVEKYALQFPSKVKAVFHNKNVGVAENFSQIYSMATGDYIAILEGDDYWTDPLKLQKQVLFLEHNRDFSLCFHNVILYYQDGSKLPHSWFSPGNQQRRRFTIKDFLNGNFIQTCTVVYRKLLPEMPRWLYDTPMGDWPFHILHTEQGDACYLEDIMAVYRINIGGSWGATPLSTRISKSIKAAEMIDKALDNKYHYQLTRTMCGWYNDLIKEYISKKENETALETVFNSLVAIQDPAAQALYIPAYLNLFINTIAQFIEKGNFVPAINIYDKNIHLFPQVSSLDRLHQLMRDIKVKFGLEAVYAPVQDVSHPSDNVPSTITLTDNCSCMSGVSVIIPVFNKFELTKQCLESIAVHIPQTPFEVIIVDNGSTDTTSESIIGASENWSWLKYHRFDTNRKFAAACNQGVRLSQYSHVLLLNNDTILSDNWLDSLYSTFDDPSVGICGSKLLYPDRTVQHAGIFFRPDLVPFHQFTRQPGDSPGVSRPLQVAAVTGASLMTRKSIFDFVGGIDESYGMYFEDVDFCLKVLKAGFKIIYNPESTFVHLEQKSSTDPLDPIKLSEKSQVIFHSRWGEYLLKMLFDQRQLLTDGCPYSVNQKVQVRI
jgi:GT2 family glycosyltransferase